MKRAVVIICIIFLNLILVAQSNTDESTFLLIRCDDSGMSNSTNLALEKMIATGLPFSTSVMFVCPWYQQTVDILKANPQVSVGVHLTLNAEWKNFRWGPILGKQVHSLTDKEGFFFPSRKTFHENNPKLEEIEAELKAQIERAVNTGLKIDYVDYHMGTAVDKPEYRAIVEKLAAQYNLGISRYFGEVDAPSIYSVKVENKKDSLINIVSNKLINGKVNLLVSHIAIDNDEMRALIDLNQFGLPEMSKHRQAELDAFASADFLALVKEGKVKLITYRELIKKIGLENMKSSFSGY